MHNFELYWSKKIVDVLLINRNMKERYMVYRENGLNKVLSRSFYERPTVIVAQELIGQILVHRMKNILLTGIITQTEAYGASDDPASHAYCGKTKRNAPMFGDSGLSYVYFVYGNHFCFNIVARSSEQTAGAVLIRGVKPIAGIEYMEQKRRYTDIKNLANGPGKLTQAFGIAGHHNFVDCTQSNELFVLKDDSIYTIDQTTRIGISQAKDKLWRFIVRSV